MPVVAVGLRCRVCKDGYRGLWSSLHFVQRLPPVRSFEINPAEFFLFSLAPDPDLFPLPFAPPSAEKCAAKYDFLSFSSKILASSDFYTMIQIMWRLIMFPFRVVYRWINSRK